MNLTLMLTLKGLIMNHKPYLISSTGLKYLGISRHLHINMVASKTNGPTWLMKAADEELASVQQKIAQTVEGKKKQRRERPTKYVRARAKLPSGAERANYDLPAWLSGPESGKFKEMMLQVFKTLANTQQRLRVIEAVVADNFVVPSKLPAIAAGIAQAEVYHKKATSGEADLGSPAPHVLYAFCMELLKSELGPAPKKAVTEDIVGRLTGLNKEEATEVVAVFLIRPCYDTEFHKITLVSQDASVRSAFAKGIKSQVDVKHYTATAPPSGQEDECQKWIEKLESMGVMGE